MGIAAGAPLLFHEGKVALHCGDCLAVLDSLSENSVDSIVCDPPYHLKSIVKRFGAANATPVRVPDEGASNDLKAAYARHARGFMGKQWDGGDIAFRVATWEKCLRVLKPGGYIIAFSSTRTYHRMACAIEDAGFITHPMIGWIFSQGFPKAHRVHAEGLEGWRYGAQSLKPALEPIYMGQKPFSEDTGTANVRRWSTGAINVDACRISTEDELTGSGKPPLRFGGQNSRPFHEHAIGLGVNQSPGGRWPANVCHDGSQEVLAAFPDAPGQQYATGPQYAPKGGTPVYGDFGARDQHSPIGDSGSAARFFYAAKADADDRLKSKHPTVKPLDLMQWLARLITPRSGVILDPFAGTGTTAHAALLENFRCISIEREPEYQDDFKRRMDLVFEGKDQRNAKLSENLPASGLPLFGGEQSR